MATSGVFTFDPSRTQIIEGALARIGVLSEGISASPEQMSSGSFWLNIAVKSLQNDGVRLWTEEYITQPIASMTQSEVTGSDGLIYSCIRTHTSATANKPITGNDFHSYWYLRGTTGGTWSETTAYSSRANFNLPTRTIGVLKAFIRDNVSDIPVELSSFRTYMDVPSKYTLGRPRTLHVNETFPTQQVFLDPIPGDSEVTNKAVIHMLVVRPMHDFTANGDTSDVPQRWIEVLILGLCERLSHVYGLDLNERQLHYQRFRDAVRLGKAEDKEAVEVQFIRGAY